MAVQKTYQGVRVLELGSVIAGPFAADVASTGFLGGITRSLIDLPVIVDNATVT